MGAYMNELSFGQRVDPENGLIQPWLTHGCLDEISKMDLSEKTILMFGAGLGDIWLAKRCKKLVVIERKEEWYSQCSMTAAPNTTYIFRPCNDSDGMAEYYTEIPEGLFPDVIINDDAYRTELCQVAVDYFKGNGGGTLICDNFDQDYVWISPKAVEILAPYEGECFIQADHRDHNGKPWQSCIWEIK